VNLIEIYFKNALSPEPETWHSFVTGTSLKINLLIFWRETYAILWKRLNKIYQIFGHSSIETDMGRSNFVSDRIPVMKKGRNIGPDIRPPDPVYCK
jgi:hypothetical protein